MPPRAGSTTQPKGGNVNSACRVHSDAATASASTLDPVLSTSALDRKRVYLPALKSVCVMANDAEPSSRQRHEGSIACKSGLGGRRGLTDVGAHEGLEGACMCACVAGWAQLEAASEQRRHANRTAIPERAARSMQLPSSTRSRALAHTHSTTLDPVCPS